MKSVLFLLGTIGFSYILNKILLRFSKNFGVESRASQNLVRWATASKPTTGGISFYISFLIGSLILLLIEPSLLSDTKWYLALFLSATLAFLIGFADDAYGTRPLYKFLGQVACGLILLAFDIHINFFSTLGNGWVILDYLLTIFWVVGMMNSLNMLDNMDAVTGTVATTIIVSALPIVILQEGLSTTFLILLIIAGGFIGFLFWNWRPAKVYMGDTGSMFIGMTLAFFGIRYFWNLMPAPDNISHTRMLLIPVMVFIVPIMDTTFVTVSRLARGSSPFVGGKDHLTHNLVRIGIPEAIVPVTLGIVSTISGLLALAAYRLTPEWRGFYSLLLALYPILVFGLFTYLYAKGMRIMKIKDAMDAQATKQRLPEEEDQVRKVEVVNN